MHIARRWRNAFPSSASTCSQPVGGRNLPATFWRRFASIENVAAIKIAPFNRYRTLDVVQGVVDAGTEDRVTLYTGNDDHIVLDLVTPFVARRGNEDVIVRIKGGLLGHWSVWASRAVEILDRCHRAVETGVDADVLALDSKVTAMNAAVFDVANDFHGCIAGCHEILRRQGLLEGIWCLIPKRALDPGSARHLIGSALPIPTSLTTRSSPAISNAG